MGFLSLRVRFSGVHSRRSDIVREKVNIREEYGLVPKKGKKKKKKRGKGHVPLCLST
jgi:hypothetical protein